jgi:hypothetical protein
MCADKIDFTAWSHIGASTGKMLLLKQFYIHEGDAVICLYIIAIALWVKRLPLPCQVVICCAIVAWLFYT